MIIEPREYFAIVRQLPDHTDTNTYYVQAKIRNAKTDALIATVNLVDKGGQRFVKPWQAVADTSGLGLWISIATSVYTDAAYTTKSGNYGDDIDTLLIQQRYNPMRRGGGDGGETAGTPDIDYKKIDKILRTALADLKIPTPEKFDLGPVMDLIAGTGKKITGSIESIKFPEAEKLDLAPHIADLKAHHETMTESLRTDMAKIPGMVKMPDLDLTPVMDMLNRYDPGDLKNVLVEFVGIVAQLDQLSKNMPDALSGLSDIKKSVENFISMLSDHRQTTAERHIIRGRQLAGLTDNEK